jgi:hypothetical protein
LQVGWDIKNFFRKFLISHPTLHQNEKLCVYINVEQNLQKLFKNAINHPEGRLSGDIFRVIQAKSARISKFKKFGYLGLSVLSLSGSVFSIKILIEQSIRLGFYDYLSLAFSDGGVLATYWKEYTLSLVDSLPVASLVASFFLLFVLFISIRRLSYQFKLVLH